MGDTAASPRLKRIQTVPLALLVTAGVVNYVDRATLAVANPLIAAAGGGVKTGAG